MDVLETIGKKTFEVIKEHDPGLSRTREFLFEKTDKPSLSQLLREAQKEEEDKEERKKEEDEARLTNFKALFEENQGSVLKFNFDLSKTLERDNFLTV